MFSTLKNIVNEAPAPREQAVVGRLLTLPAGAQPRAGEGGLRLAGKFKRRAAASGIPLVTIITVCRNAAGTIGQCMDSVFRQTWENVEYIVVDGASTDGTRDLLRQHDHAIDYWVSEPDGGLYQAMNKGLSLAGGDFVLVLNADDWYEADCVESLVRARTCSDARFVSALARRIDASGNAAGEVQRMPFDDGARLRMPLRHETMLIPAEIYDEVGGFDESYRIIADLEWTIRLYEAGHSHYEVPRPLLHFRNNGVSSVDLDGLFSERRRLVRAQFPFLDEQAVRDFGELARLQPHRLEELASRHPDERKFLEAAARYAASRAGIQSSRPWREAAGRLRSLAARGRPLVSVILPVHNAQATLRACVDSVLAQTLRDFELICIDDASPDGSRAIIESYAARDSRVIVLANERNEGLGRTRNRGVRAARGQYVFHVDPDDSLPAAALETLHARASRHGSDMVKGAYLHRQLLFGAARNKTERRSLCRDGVAVVNTNLSKMPRLLQTTEGHWSCLYEAGLARRVPYPTNLKMGQDSMFLVRMLLEARSVTIVDDVIYHYSVNPASAMNTFSFRKYRDALEWRRRSWHLLNEAGLRAIADRLLQSYWNPAFFTGLASSAGPEELALFFREFRSAFAQTVVAPVGPGSTPFLKDLFPLIVQGRDAEARRFLLSKESGDAREEKPAAPARTGAAAAATAPAGTKFSVATLCASDYGGAGTGSLRRVAALRKHGIDARLYSLLKKSGADFVRRIAPQLPGLADAPQEDVWKEALRRSVGNLRALPGFRASEMFSLPGTVLDFRDLKKIFDAHDIVHLHWVVGMLDCEHLGEVLSRKPVVWTLADMNPFTGGCHYSEGCEGYKRECRSCPLLGGDSDIAHETWKIKKQAYDKLENLQIICPSPWMAERVRESSLLGDRPVHCIPNALPLDVLSLASKAVARARLGLPLDKKLVLFGSDNLGNRRKGGDLLKEALRHFRIRSRNSDAVELVVFGAGTIEAPLPVHPLGYVTDANRLALMYSAADAFLFPSREDNSPLTVGESLLCGTPVVAFPVGNVPALVEHRVTGYVARNLDTRDFAAGIEWVLGAAPATALARSASCRTLAGAYHDPGVSAERHEAIYRLAMTKTD